MAKHETCPDCGSAWERNPLDTNPGPVCPSCRNETGIRAPREAPTSTTPRKPIPVNEPVVLEAAESEEELPFVTSEAINRKEEHDPRFDSENEANRSLGKWKRLLPEVPRAYQPSGTIPTAAKVTMPLGAAVGSVTGGLSSGVLVAIFVALIVAASAVFAMILVCGFIACGLMIFAAIFGLIAFAAIFAAGGWVSAEITTWFGRLGNNRNVRWAVILSALSGGLGIFLAWLLFQLVGDPLLGEKELSGPHLGDFNIVALVVAVLGLPIATWVAGYFAGERVRTTYFCEKCQRFMTRSELGTLGFGGLRGIHQELIAKKFTKAVGLLNSQEGEEGTVELVACPECSEGYIELTANFSANWPDDKPRGQKKGDKKESWLVVSEALDAEQVEIFRGAV